MLSTIFHWLCSQAESLMDTYHHLFDDQGTNAEFDYDSYARNGYIRDRRGEDQ